MIRDDIDELVELLDVQVIAYDPHYASELIDYCEEKHPDILLVEFSQSAAHFEKPIDDFEAAIKEGHLKHDNNGCMNWQVGHANVKTTPRGYRILVKPDGRNDIKKIDAIVASIMSHWASNNHVKRVLDYYENNPLEVI